MIAQFRDERGRTSYQVLAREVFALGRDTNVLDLACGDGPLLEILAADGFSHLTGVDQSHTEIGAAKARLGASAALHCQDARRLPFPNGSMDSVLCHLALMLFDPIEPVLAEVARVLRPRGLFAAIINRRHPDPVFDLATRELRRITTEAGMEPLKLGAPDVFTRKGVHARLSAAGLDEGSVAIRDFIVQARAKPEQIWPFFEARYDVFRLPQTSQAAFKRALMTGLRALVDGEGLLRAEMGMRLITCRARAEEPST